MVEFISQPGCFSYHYESIINEENNGLQTAHLLSDISCYGYDFLCPDIINSLWPSDAI